MPFALQLADYVQALPSSPLAHLGDLAPWEWTQRAPEIVQALLATLPVDGYSIQGDIARHRSARVEQGVVLKGPLVLGAGCLVASGAYLRGGNWVGDDCVLGPGTELKSSFLFARTTLAHFNFVGDSIIGSGVNLEAGSVVCNFRNERADPEVRVVANGTLQRTGVRKFGALIGDGARLGANAVLAPGAIVRPRTVVARLELLDQDPTR